MKTIEQFPNPEYSNIGSRLCHEKIQTRRKNRTKGDPNNAARERHRVRLLRNAFTQLQQTLPSIPPDTKLSKLDILILATAYIGQLSTELLNDGSSTWTDKFEECSTRIRERRKLHKSFLHPVKKWPMRSTLYSSMVDKTTHVKMELSFKEKNRVRNKREAKEKSEMCNGINEPAFKSGDSYFCEESETSFLNYSEIGTTSKVKNEWYNQPENSMNENCFDSFNEF